MSGFWQRIGASKKAKLTGGMQSAFALAKQLLLVPLIVNNIGVEGFGFWIAINSVAGLVRVVVMGPVNYELKQYAESYNRGKELPYDSIRICFIWTIVVVGITAGIVSPLFHAFGNWSVIQLIMLLTLVIARLSHTLAVSFVSRFQDVSGRVYQRMLDELLFDILELLVLSAAIIGTQQLSLGIYGICAVNSLLAFFFVKRIIKTEQIVLPSQGSFHHLKECLLKSKDFAKTTLAEKSFENGIPLVVKFVADDRVLGLFSIYKVVFNLFLRVATITGDIIVPKFQAIFFKGDSSVTIRRELKQYFCIQFTMFFAGIAAVFFGLFEVVMSWIFTNPTFRLDWAILVLLAGLLSGLCYLNIEGLKRIGILRNVTKYYIIKMAAIIPVVFYDPMLSLFIGELGGLILCAFTLDESKRFFHLT